MDHGRRVAARGRRLRAPERWVGEWTTPRRPGHRTLRVAVFCAYYSRMAGWGAWAAGPLATSPLAVIQPEYPFREPRDVTGGTRRLREAAFSRINSLRSFALRPYNDLIMAEAKITLPDGIEVSVSGTPEEITAVVSRLQGGVSAPRNAGSAAGRSRPKTPSGRARAHRVGTATDRVGALQTTQGPWVP